MSMRSAADRKVQVAFGTAIAVLIVVGAFCYRSLVASNESTRWVRHSHQVLESLQELAFATEASTSSVRKFVITGVETDLDIYRAAKLDDARIEPILRSLTADNPRQQSKLPEIEALIAKRFARSEEIISLRRDQGFEAAIEAVRTGGGAQRTAAINDLGDQLRDEELRLLALREADEARHLVQTKTILVLGTLLGLMIAAGAGWSMERHRAERNQAEAVFKKSELRYQLAVQGMSVGLWDWDVVTNELAWSPRFKEIIGISDAEFVPHYDEFESRLHPEDKERTVAMLRAHVRNEGPYDVEYRLRRNDGAYAWIHATGQAAWDASGNPLHMVGSVDDISVRKDAQKHLAQMEARYRGLLEAAPDAMVVVVNQRGDIVLLNLQAEKQFGYRRDELLGQPVKNIIPEGFAERLIADDLRSAEDALAQRIGTGIELTARRKDGSAFPIEIMLSPLESADGILVTAAIRDISVRKDAQKHLAQMEARYRGLLEAAPDAMVVVNQRSDIVLLNLQAEKQFGYRRDELLGQPVKNIIPEGFAERLIADDLRSDEDALAQQIGTGIELTARRKDGSAFPIEIMLSPLESADGILVTAAIRDISVRRAAEEHLVQMEGRYRGLLEAAPDAMVVVNQGGEIVLLNLQAEKQFGYRRDELLGQRVTNIIPEGFAERLIADDLRSAEDALAQQIGTGIELTARRKDGSAFPIEIMLSPLESADGILVTAAIRDISVRKAAEAEVTELNRSNEELENFAHVLVHDLKAPTRSIQMFASYLETSFREENPEAIVKDCRRIGKAAQRMDTLIDTLYQYITAQSQAVFERIETEQVMKDTLSNLEYLIRERGANVTSGALPAVTGNAAQLGQLLQNLMGNGIKYCEAAIPSVHITASQHGAAEWLFSVRDNGIGIPKEYSQQVFQPFKRLHGTEKYEGAGLGLATCMKIVQHHGGTIWCESSEAPGTTFFFTLPGVQSHP
jgi:PAS domain S-box-containing protein